MSEYLLWVLVGLLAFNVLMLRMRMRRVEDALKKTGILKNSVEDLL